MYGGMGFGLFPLHTSFDEYIVGVKLIILLFFYFSCRFLNPNYFFQFEFELF